jgi:hypothetical protein
MSFDLKISDGDLVIGSNGDLQQVTNTDKLIQDLLKIAITPLGGNPFYPWYGSPISKSLIGTSFSTDFIASVASSQLRSSLETLQKLQRAQAAAQGMTALEQLAAIQEVRIERNMTDPRFFTVIIKALTKALTTVKTEFAVNGL